MKDSLSKPIITTVQNNLKKENITLIYLKVTAHHYRQISTSHSAPKGIDKNWNNIDKTRPFYYPGWSGRVWAIYTKAPSGVSTTVYANSGLHTGTGGYGTYGRLPLPKNFILPAKAYPTGYECKLFEQDFPEFQTMILLNIVEKDAPFNFTYLNPLYFKKG